MLAADSLKQQIEQMKTAQEKDLGTVSFRLQDKISQLENNLLIMECNLRHFQVKNQLETTRKQYRKENMDAQRKLREARFLYVLFILFIYFNVCFLLKYNLNYIAPRASKDTGDW